MIKNALEQIKEFHHSTLENAKIAAPLYFRFLMWIFGIFIVVSALDAMEYSITYFTILILGLFTVVYLYLAFKDIDSRLGTVEANLFFVFSMALTIFILGLGFMFHNKHLYEATTFSVTNEESAGVSECDLSWHEERCGAEESCRYHELNCY